MSERGLKYNCYSKNNALGCRSRYPIVIVFLKKIYKDLHLLVVKQITYCVPVQFSFLAWLTCPARPGSVSTQGSQNRLIRGLGLNLPLNNGKSFSKKPHKKY